MSNWTLSVTDSRNDTYKASRCFVDDPTSTKSAKVVGYSAIIIVSLIGNTLLFHTSLKDKSTRRSINWFIANICLANLLITIIYMPRMIVMVMQGTAWLVGGTLGVVLCKVVPSIHHVCILVSILSLAALSVDRYFYIVIPTRQFLDSKKVKIVFPLMWTVAILVRLPSLYASKISYNFKNNEELFSCSVRLSEVFKSRFARTTYYTILLVVFYVLPLLVMIILYSIIVIILQRKKAPTAFHGEKKYKEASRKILKMLITVSVSFVVCWATYFVAQIAYTKVPCSLRFWRFFLAHCNSALSPCLCIIFNKKYRDHINVVLARCC